VCSKRRVSEEGQSGRASALGQAWIEDRSGVTFAGGRREVEDDLNETLGQERFHPEITSTTRSRSSRRKGDDTFVDCSCGRRIMGEHRDGAGEPAR
jgi:hypothetical protein